MKTEDILNERKKTHGDFDRVAETWVQLMNIVDDNISSDNCGQIAAIYMILLKLARIACGNSDFADHWDDIAGYAELGKGKEWHKMTKRSCWRCGDKFLREESDKQPLCRQCEQWLEEKTEEPKEEGINARCRVCNKKISKGTSICYWCAVNGG